MATNKMVGAGFSLRIIFLNPMVFRTLKGAATSNNLAHKNNLTKSREDSGTQCLDFRYQLYIIFNKGGDDDAERTSVLHQVRGLSK